MRKKEFKLCIAQFEGWLRNDLRPEQKEAIESCLKQIKDLARRRNRTELDVARCVSEISRKLFEAWKKQG